MDDFDSRPVVPAQDSGDNTVALFLALYLLILAFFILLVSISTTEKIKSQAVMDSLSSSFTSLLTPSANPTTFTSKEGDLVAAAQHFQEEITGVFSSELQIAQVTIVQPGRLMQVALPSDALFVPNETRIREARYPLLDRIIAAISNRPAGLRWDMEFIIGSKYAVGKSLPIGETLEMTRAGAFAREVLARGAPPDSVMVGMEPGDPGRIVIWFHGRNLDEQRLDFTTETLQERKPH